MSIASHSQRVYVLIAKPVLACLAGLIASVDWLYLNGAALTLVAYASLFILVVTSRVKTAALVGCLFAIAKIGTSFWWAADMLSYTLNMEGFVPKIVFSGMVFWEAIPFMIIGAITGALFVKSPVVGTFFWICSLSALASFWPRVFRWDIGHTLLSYPVLAQCAEIGGGAALSFGILCCSVIPWLSYRCVSPCDTVSKLERFGLAMAISIPLLGWGWSVSRFAYFRNIEVSASAIAIGCAQAFPADRDSIVKLRRLTDNHLASADLICWPESTLGIHSHLLRSFSDFDETASMSIEPHIDPQGLIGIDKPLLVGGRCFIAEKSESVPYYQTAYLLDRSSGVVERYHKRGLMPLGEYVPGEDYLPFLHDTFQLGNYFLKGENANPLFLEDGTAIGALVCYEDTSPRLVRDSALRQPDFFVCLINAAAFQHPIALQQHLRLAQLRSIENRKYLLRASGTGVTCGVNILGELVNPLDIDKETAAVYRVPKLQITTFYTQLGDVVGFLLGCLAAILAVIGVRIGPSNAH